MKQQPILNKFKDGGRLALVCFVIILSLLGSTTAQAKVAEPKLAVRAAIAIDATTGQVLYEKNAQKALPIASVSKLLSSYIVLKQIQSGKLKWNTPVKIDKATAALSTQSELTNVPLKAGRHYHVKDLFNASLIYSANAAITALGTKVAGSPQKFISMMRETALKLGLKSAKLVTASGITNGQAGRALGDPKEKRSVENEMSATDVAKLSKKVLQEFPSIVKVTRVREAWFDKGHSSQTAMTNWNLLLKGQSEASKNLPVDGLKTGTSDKAGGNFVGTVAKNGHRIITVVMHARSSYATDPARFIQTRRLMNWVYATYHPVALKAGDRVSGAKNVLAFYGKDKDPGLKLASATTLWLLKNQSESSVSGTVKIAGKYREKDGLKTPVSQNEEVGQIALKVAGKPINCVEGPLQESAETVKKVERANWFVRTWRNGVSWF